MPPKRIVRRTYRRRYVRKSPSITSNYVSLTVSFTTGDSSHALTYPQIIPTGQRSVILKKLIIEGSVNDPGETVNVMFGLIGEPFTEAQGAGILNRAPGVFAHFLNGEKTRVVLNVSKAAQRNWVEGISPQQLLDIKMNSLTTGVLCLTLKAYFQIGPPNNYTTVSL